MLHQTFKCHLITWFKGFGNPVVFRRSHPQIAVTLTNLTKNGKINPSTTERTDMAMDIKGENLIVDFTNRVTESKKSMTRWVDTTKAATWNIPNDIHGTFTKVDTVKSGYIFNVRNNEYRIHASVIFPLKTVVILKVGTHPEYDKWTDL